MRGVAEDCRRAPGAMLFALRDLLARRRFLRFVLIGGVNTAVGYALFLLALRMMPNTFVALCLSTFLGIAFNFASTGTFVFGSRDVRRVPRFYAVYAIVFAYNAAGLWLLETMNVAPWLAGIILLPGAVILSYLLNRRFVFGGRA